MSNTFRENVTALIELRNVTDPKAFDQKPSGYAKRARATLFQLAVHTNKAVRRAVAESPLLGRTMIVAMFETEEDKAIKAILEPRYQAALSAKTVATNALIVERDDEIASLKEALAKARA